MRGHLQSTNRRLNRHWQSGGGRGHWEWWDYHITFNSAIRYSNPIITTTPSSKIMTIKRYATFRITADRAVDGNGNVAPVPDSFAVGSLIELGDVYHFAASPYNDVTVYKGQDYNPDGAVVNPVTGYTETGIKVPANSYKDLIIDLTTIQHPYTQQDFNIQRRVEPYYRGDFVPDFPLSSQYNVTVYGKIGVRFDSRS